MKAQSYIRYEVLDKHTFGHFYSSNDILYIFCCFSLFYKFILEHLNFKKILTVYIYHPFQCQNIYVSQIPNVILWELRFVFLWDETHILWEVARQFLMFHKINEICLLFVSGVKHWNFYNRKLKQNSLTKIIQ